MQGSVVIITINKDKPLADRLKVSIVDFRDVGLTTAFDCKLCKGTGAVFLPQLYADGRKYGGAIDTEPEFTSISDDSKYAYVTLQENNAVAIISLQGNGASLCTHACACSLMVCAPNCVVDPVVYVGRPALTEL